MGFKVIPHTADLAIEVTGGSMAELLESAMLGFRFLVAGEKPFIQNTTEIFSIGALDKESLLVRFLNRLIYLFDTVGFLPAAVNIEINGLTLRAEVTGEIFDGTARHCVKATTYHGLKVAEKNGLLSTQIILDD